MLVSHVIQEGDSAFKPTFNKDDKGKASPHAILRTKDGQEKVSFKECNSVQPHTVLFKKGSLTYSKMKVTMHKERDDAEKRQFIKVIYPDFTKEMTELHVLPFRRWIVDIKAEHNAQKGRELELSYNENGKPKMERHVPLQDSVGRDIPLGHARDVVSVLGWERTMKRDLLQSDDIKWEIIHRN